MSAGRCTLSGMTEHVKWTEIDNFHNARRKLTLYPELLDQGASTVSYRAKVKLHGTNAGIKISQEGVTALSRTSVLSLDSDNAGFARWVYERQATIAKLAPLAGALVLFGEWCGPGIQKGVAVNLLKAKVFAVFAARLVDHPGVIDFLDDPETLSRLTQVIPGCYVLPWYQDGEAYMVNWAASDEALQPTLDRINQHVLAVEECDPWVRNTFGVEGTGEGLVFYPVPSGAEADEPSLGSDYKRFSNLCFKAKGEKHHACAVTRTAPAQASATVTRNAADFASLVVTGARLEQGLSVVCGGSFDPKKTGVFLAWLTADVLKECNAELACSGLDAKTAQKAVSDAARQWYVAGCKKL